MAWQQNAGDFGATTLRPACPNTLLAAKRID